VLTGETGAGKSILLDALGLALGARADSGLVRSGQDGARFPPSSTCRRIIRPRLLDEQGIECEPGEPLLLRRTLKADGGSRAFVGGRPGAGRGAARDRRKLVEIHGQHDDRGLLNPKGHRALLDAFGRRRGGWSGSPMRTRS
jgi:DNA repair protein RecN (Recombination protein N)